MSGSRFSRRTGWPMQTNRWSRLRLAREAAGDRLFDLTVSNPSQVGLQLPEQEFSALSAAAVSRYEPEPRGLSIAREAVAGIYAEAGIQIAPEQLTLTASTSEAYSFLFKLLADPGDKVLIPHPGYPLFDFLSGLESVEPVPYRLDPDDNWSIDLEALAARDPEGIRAVILVNPGNPTGHTLKRQEWGRLQELCRLRGWAVISDEVFSPYALREDPQRVVCAAAEAAEADVLTFSLGGLSKWAGLPQLKLAWIVAGGPRQEVEAALERLEVITDTYLSVSTPVQEAAPRLMVAGKKLQTVIQARLCAHRELLAQTCAGTSCHLEPSEGGWSAVLRVPALRSSEEWALGLLEDDGVLVHPGYFYDFPREAYLVLSLLPTAEVFEAGTERLVARVQSLV